MVDPVSIALIGAAGSLATPVVTQLIKHVSEFTTRHENTHNSLELKIQRLVAAIDAKPKVSCGQDYLQNRQRYAWISSFALDESPILRDAHV